MTVAYNPKDALNELSVSTNKCFMGTTNSLMTAIDLVPAVVAYMSQRLSHLSEVIQEYTNEENDKLQKIYYDLTHDEKGKDKKPTADEISKASMNESAIKSEYDAKMKPFDAAQQLGTNTRSTIEQESVVIKTLGNLLTVWTNIISRINIL
jgi:hypothetical protein